MNRKMSTSTRPEQRSRGKRLLFHLITLLLFFLALELVLALVGIRPVLVEEDPYVGFSGTLKLFEPSGDGRLETAQNKLTLFNRQSFSREKPRGVRRIFTLGGSVTYGRPFDDSTSFSGWLRTYLERLRPGEWELVNAGGISYASYRVATLMEELVEYEPDLFVIYSGHNEFLEKRTYGELAAEPEVLTRSKLLLQRSRIWALGRKVVDRRREKARERFVMTGEVEELLDTSVGLDYYFRDESFKAKVLEHYRFNLVRMIRLARRAGAEVLLVTIPVNEKDFSPFKSQHREALPVNAVQRHGQLLAGALQALDRGAPEEARELASEAVEIDPLHAEGQYLLGRTLSELGRHEEAGRSYARAIEEDVCPLRALAETVSILERVAHDEQVPLVDYRRLLQETMLEREGHSNLGDELFLDHAHPTVEAHGILARALLEAMADESLLDLGPDSLASVGPAVRQDVMSRVDAEAKALSYKNLSKLLIWAGKKREAEKYVQLATEVLADDWELRYNAGLVQLENGQPEQAIESFLESVALQPSAAAAHDMLGFAYASVGELELAIRAGRQAVRVDPEMAGAWNNLGTHYGAAGNLADAVAASRQAIALDPSFAEAHNNLGKALFDSGQLEEALKHLDRAIALRPGYSEAMINRGLVLGALERYSEVVEALQEALRLTPDSPAALTGLARAHLALGETTTAIPLLERLVTRHPDRLEDQELLVMTLRSERGPEAAVQALASALAIHPQAARLHYLQGRLLAEQGRLVEAEKSFEAALEHQDPYLAALVDLGNVRMARDRHEQAISAFRAALELAPRDGRLHHVYATALLIAGRIEEGVTELETALELDADNALVAQDLALVYEQLGRSSEARELFDRALRLDPTLEDARAGRARLGAG